MQLWLGETPNHDASYVFFSRFGKVSKFSSILWELNWSPLQLDTSERDDTTSYIDFYAHSIEWRIGEGYFRSRNIVADVANLLKVFAIATESVRIGMAQVWRLGPDFEIDEPPEARTLLLSAAHYPKLPNIDLERFLILNDVAVRSDAFDRLGDMRAPDQVPPKLPLLTPLNALISKVFEHEERMQAAEEIVGAALESRHKLPKTEYEITPSKVDMLVEIKEIERKLREERGESG